MFFPAGFRVPGALASVGAVVTEEIFRARVSGRRRFLATLR
jgi:hypothetical protein